MKMKERLIKMISVLLLGASVFGFASCSTDVTAETAESAPVIPIPETDGFTGNKVYFAVLVGRVPDEGVCIELGIAYANGKCCYGFKSDARSVELGGGSYERLKNVNAMCG